MKPITSQQGAEQLAREILDLSRNTLLIRLRFLEPALCQLPFDTDSQITLATDGFCFYYNFIHVLKTYRTSRELLMRDYLHTVFHCIFHHPFIGTLVDSYAWNLACDIAVEAALSELELSELSCSRCMKQQEILTELKEYVPVLTAEKLYRHFHDSGMPPEEMETLRSYFLADEHDMWYQLSSASDESNTSNQNPDKDSDSETQESKEDSDDGSHGEDQKSDSQTKRSDSGFSEEENEADASPSPSPSKDEQEKLWQEIASRIQTDLETLSRQYGEKTGTLLQNIKECTREKTDYHEFLRKFAVLGEEMRINDEEFDYIYYTYGLDLYEDIPLIEPLEYKDVKKIREFVIAIDTSASVKGELVTSFLQKTFEILTQEDVFFNQTELHIIECDTSIQNITVIRKQEQLRNYIYGLEHADSLLHGFGGTDFRPVFAYVKDRQEQGDLRNLQGLLYFTDGDGIYPEMPADYHTAFLFTQKADASVKVPIWAMKVLLDETSIMESV